MKKFILSGISTFIVILLFNFLTSSSAFAFLGFGEGGSALTLDCDEILKKITKGNEVVGEWGANPVGGYKYITDKKVLNRQDEGYCYLYRGQSEDVNEAGQSTGQYNNEEEIKIFYFTDSSSAIAKLQELKKGERDDFKMKNSDELSYSGHTESEGEGFFEENGEPKQYSVDIPNYARTVRALGNCLTEAKYFDHMDRHGWSFKTRENFIWQVAEWYNGITEGFDKAISTSEDILTFCGAKSPGSSTVQAKQQAKPTPQPATKQTPGPFGIFGINPYETWLNLKGLIEVGTYMKSEAVIQDAEYMLSPGYRSRMEKEADASKLTEKLKFIEEAETRFADLSHQEKIKAGEIIKELDARFELYPMNGQKGTLEQGEYWPMLKSGAIDVIVQPQDGKQFEIQTPNTEIMVIGTEFSVIYDQKQNETMVIVYKGKVEVKTNDGKVTTVVSDGDKPGVVVISQKLSFTKLAIGGLTPLVVITGLIFIMKKKLAPSVPSKKKR